jgi:hypothetical protein
MPRNSRLDPYTELADLPLSDWGFLLVSKMTDAQKVYFLKLLGDLPAAISDPYGRSRVADQFELV